MTSLRSYIKRLLNKPNFITIVSGLPRSGTSMMMAALKAGGLDLLTDGVRRADTNNPKGYYEFERVKKLPDGDDAWLNSAQGKAVKVISTLLPHLPDRYSYRIIFMTREMDEILASQSRMLERTGRAVKGKGSDADLRESYMSHLKEMSIWLDEVNWAETCFVSYNEILCQPLAEFQRVASFLNGWVDPDAMVEVVDPNLYRTKG